MTPSQRPARGVTECRGWETQGEGEVKERATTKPETKHASRYRATEPDAEWIRGAGRGCSCATYQHGGAKPSIGRPGDLSDHEQLVRTHGAWDLGRCKRGLRRSAGAGKGE
jgi:hypothetical protein